jgi:hypothetical protein
LPEWLVEAGVGETRAALVERDTILEMAVERDDAPHRAGAVLAARLARKGDGSGRARVELADGTPAQLIPAPAGLSEGARLRVEVTREALPEAGGTKMLRVRETDAEPGPGLDLAGRLRATGLPVRSADLDPVGWSEALEEASTGVVARPEAMLHISPTPAMTLIDVDGNGDPVELAIAGAQLAARMIRRFGIAGSIGIDLPTLTAKADRMAAAEALDAVLPQPFERTAVNGFGFLQIVRRRVRPSLVELLAADPAGAAALALLRAGERARGAGPLTLSAHPAVIARLAARPDWTDSLARRVGAPIGLREAAGTTISGGHAARLHP